MISYSQNFEDVMLQRAFAQIDAGFYVDVGAWDPNVHSVTRHFYERGWRGVNIEPHPAYHDMLERARPRDVNLRVAVSDRPGVAEITLIHGTGISTLRPEIAAMHERLDYRHEQVEVETRTLDSIFETFAPKEVHFLKIDCEGAESDVVNAFDLARFRPWIILVEATKPLSREETHAAWEPHILEANYRFAYFDGVNRFYVAAEHDDLRRHFELPPNVFDEFIVDYMRIPAPTRRQGVGKLFAKLLGRIEALRA